MIKKVGIFLLCLLCVTYFTGFCNESNSFGCKFDYSKDNLLVDISGNGVSDVEYVVTILNENGELLYINNIKNEKSFSLNDILLPIDMPITDVYVNIDFGAETLTLTKTVFSQSISQAVVIDELKELSVDDFIAVFDTVTEYSNCGDECLYIFELLSDEQKILYANEIQAMLANITDKKELRKNITDYFLTNYTLKTTWVDLKDIAVNKMDILSYPDVNSSDYSSLSATQQSNVFKNIFAYAVDIDNTDELVEALNREINNVVGGSATTRPSVGGGGSSGGGSSGGGGFGGYKDTSAVTVPMTNVELNDNVDAFDDIDTVPWAKTAIEELAKKGIVKGMPNGDFMPDSSITRAEFVSIIVRAFELKTDEQIEFEDVNEDDWYYDAVNIAAKNNIIYGFDGRFMPGDKITRQDTAVILQRLLQLEKNNEQAVNYVDAEFVSEYARESVEILSSNGVMNGFENLEFAPNGYLTRAETAVVICRCLERYDY